MKKAATVLVALIAVLLMASCSNDTAQPQEHRITPEVGKPHTLQISSKDTVTLTGLEVGELYGINAPIRLPNMYWSNVDTNLFIATTTSMSFTGAELGISGTGQVTVFKYEAVVPDSGTGMKLDTSGPALYSYTADGYRWDVYEAFYEVDINTLGFSSLSEVGVYDYVTGNGSYRSDCCIVEIRDDGSWHIYRPYKLLSFKDGDKIYVFNQIAVRRGEWDEDLVLEIVFENPIKIGNSEINLNPRHGLYKVSATDCTDEMVLELNIGTNDVRSYDVTYGNITPRYIDNGWERKPYLFPFGYDESTGTLLLYVGSEGRDFFFDILMDAGISNPGTIKLRPLEPDESDYIKSCVLNIASDPEDNISDGKMTIEIPIAEGEYFRPVVFEADSIDNLQVRAHFPRGFNVRLVARDKDGDGYSSYGMSDLYIADIHDDFILEHAFVRNSGMTSGTVTIELSTNGFSPIDQPKVEVDGSTLTEDLSEPETISWDSRLVFKNLTPGSFYVLYFGENEDVWNDEFIWIRDGLIGFLATDTEKEVNISEFGITASCQIQFAQFAPSDTFESSASDTDYFVQTEDGYMTIACFKLSGLKTGQPYLFSVDSTEGGNGYPIVLDNRGHELYSTFGNNTYVFDESEMTAIMVINVWDGEVQAELELIEPTAIGHDGQSYRLPGLFIFDADPSEELVLEMTFDSEYPPSWWTVNSIGNGSAYNLDTGNRVKHFVPFSYDDGTNTVVCYLGKQDGRIIISMPNPIYASGTRPNTIRIRKISEIEKKTVTENTKVVDADPMTIDLPATTYENLPMAVFLEGVDADARYDVAADFADSEQYQYVMLIGENVSSVNNTDWTSTELREGFGLDTIYLDSELMGPATITIDKR